MKRNKLLLLLALIVILVVTLCACNKPHEVMEDDSVSLTIYYLVDYEIYSQSRIVDGIIQDDVEDPVSEGHFFNGWLLDEYDETSTLASKSIDDLIALTNEVLASGEKYIYVYASFSNGGNVNGAGLLAFNYSRRESISSMTMNGTVFTFVQKYTYNINNHKEDFSLDGRFKLSPTATYEVYEKLQSGEYVESTLDVHLAYEYASATRYILVSCYDDYKKETDQELYEFIVIRGFERDSKATFTASEYFRTLWECSSALGHDEIDTNGFVKAAVDFSIELNEVEVKTEKVNQAIAIGFHIEMVVNCKDKDLNGTSVKLQLYDPAHNNNENFLTMYYFVDTPGYYYFDGDDERHVRFKIQNGIENELASMLSKLLNDSQIILDLLDKFEDFVILDMDPGENSIMDILLDMARTMGPDWTFNDAFASFCKSFDFDIYSEISRYSGIIATFLNISEDELFDENGNLQLDTILCTPLMNNLFLASLYEHNGIVTCQAKLNPIIIAALTSPAFAKMFKVKNIDKLIGYKTNAIMSYDIVDGKFDGFDIAFGLGDVIATVDGVKKYTQLKFCFNDISVTNAAPGETVSMPIAKEDYSKDIVFNMDIKSNVENISGLHNDKEYDLSGDFDTSIKFRLDTETMGMIENNTQLYTYMAHNGGKFVEISLNDGKLALSIDRSVVVKTAQGEEAPIVEVLASMVGDNFKEFFEGSIINVFDRIRKNDDKEIVYRVVLSIIDPSLIENLFNVAFEKKVDGTYDYDHMKDDFVGIVVNDFDCQKLLAKITKAYFELPEKLSFHQSKTISHIEAVSSSALDNFDVETIATAIKRVMPIIHTDLDRLKVETTQFADFVDSLAALYVDDFILVDEIVKGNTYRDLEFFASNLVFSDHGRNSLDKEGFSKFIETVFSADITAILDFNGLATDNAIEIYVGIDSFDDFYIDADLTMNLDTYKPDEYVDVAQRAYSGGKLVNGFTAYKLVIYDEAQDCDDYIRIEEEYAEKKAEDIEKSKKHEKK